MVPHFKRLSDFIRAQRQFMRFVSSPFLPGPERHDIEARLRRHHSVRPDFSSLQVPFKPKHETHIEFTSDPHKPGET